MVRIVFGVIAGFIAWLIAWVGSEKILSAIWPEFGAHQLAFQAAIENGGQFTADTTMLLTHIVLGSIVSVMSGFLAALIAGENKRAPLNPQFSAGGIWFTEGGYVLAVCSHLVSHYFYGDSNSNDDYRR
jgi:hypothetical protein